MIKTKIHKCTATLICDQFQLKNLKAIHLTNYHMLQSWHGLPLWVRHSLHRYVKYFVCRPLEQTVVGLQHILLLFSTDRVKLKGGGESFSIVIVNYILSKVNNSKYA